MHPRHTLARALGAFLVALLAAGAVGGAAPARTEQGLAANGQARAMHRSLRAHPSSTPGPIELTTSAPADSGYLADLIGDAGAVRAAGEAALATSTGLTGNDPRADLTQALDDLSAAGSDTGSLTSALEHVADATTRVTAAVAAQQTAQASARAASPRSAPAPDSKTGPAGRVPAPARSSVSVRDVGEQTLRSLPGNEGVHLSWDDPGLGGHLGGVFEGNTSTILINGARLAGNPSKTSDVVRHEMGHIYAGRLMVATGLTWGQLGAAQAPAFGSNAPEKVADCVARHFGATWTNYTSDCSGSAKQAWVAALIAGHMP